MAELVINVHPGPGRWFYADMNLYCWPCRSVHEFVLADVERIIYSLVAMERHAYEVAGMDPPFGREMAESPPSCLNTVLRVAGDPEMALEHVEQGVTCRAAE